MRRPQGRLHAVRGVGIPARPPLGLLVFVTGTSSLGAEIAAARLLAPYFGDSTIVWANTIGVVLVALSVGYWLGGRLADRNPTRHGLCRLVLLAAALLAVVPLVADPILGISIEAFDSLSAGAFAGSLFGVLVLVAIPLVLVGAVSPWAIRLSLDDVEKSGQVTGRLYAISTFGSLVGTFAAALVLIPFLGTQRTFLLFALLLAAVAALGLRPRWALAPVAIAVLLALPPGVTKAAGEGDRVLDERDTEYQYARVVEAPDGERRLELNEGQAVHSVWRRGTVLTGNYWDAFLVDPVAGLGRPPGRMAILGDGAGTMVRAYGAFFPDTRIDAVEIDGELTDIGRTWFGLRDRPGVSFVTEDARPFLRQSDGGYDAIFVDAYHQPYVPFYLTTEEFFRLVRSKLRPGGVVLVNVGHPEPSTKLEDTLAATMRQSFGHVARDPVEPVNTVLIGSDAPVTGAKLAAAVPQLPAPLRELASDTAVRIAPARRGGDVYTDDKAPVEWLIDQSLVEYAAGGD